MIDGTVARKTGITSEFGSRLDTIADVVFVAVCLIKLIPVLNIPSWLFIWIIIVALIKMINVILPLILKIIDLRYSGAFVCAASTFAAIQEGHFIRTGRWDTDHDKTRV